MKLDDVKPSDNYEDHSGRGGGGGFGFPGGGGRRINIPMGGRGGGLSIKTIIFLAIVYFVLKLVFGIDLLQVINGGGLPVPGQTDSQITYPDGSTDVTDAGGGDVTAGPSTSPADATGEPGKIFVRKVLATTETVWKGIFTNLGSTYEPPVLVTFTNFDQSACGMAQSAMGPFYCPADRKVYIDLSFYQDMKTKLGAPGDFAQAYVIAHEVGHHVQNLLGIADKVQQERSRVSEEEGNLLSVRMELQGDCFAGIWAQNVDAKDNRLQDGDIEEALNAASQIGDDRLQKKSQGYVVPESFTHGSSAQRVKWFKTGMSAADLRACDTFGTDNL